MFRVTLKAGLLILLVGSMSQFARAAGADAAPPISGQTIDMTNGNPTCHVDDADDKVALSADALDSDTIAECSCQTGNRIDRDETQWACTSGQLDSLTGATNQWMAGTNIGQYSVTATFHDKNDGADCDDDSVTKTITVTAFKVGIHIASSGGASFTRWEDSTDADIGFSGSLTLDHILTSSPNPAEDGQNSAVTWTLKTSPDGALMKKYIHAMVHAWGGQGQLNAVVADSDWFDDGSANVSIGINAGVVFIGTTVLLGDDNNAAGCAAGVGFGSELYTDYSCKTELVSATTTGPSQNQALSHSPADAWLIGGAGTSKQAEWEMKYKLEKKTTEGNWAAAEVDMDMNYEWTVTDTLPYYGP